MYQNRAWENETGFTLDPTGRPFEKRKEGTMKIRKNQTIKFTYISDLTGKLLALSGIIIGFGKEVRKMWPEEMGEAPDEMMLVWRKDDFGNEFHHAVSPEEVIEEAI